MSQKPHGWAIPCTWQGGIVYILKLKTERTFGLIYSIHTSSLIFNSENVKLAIILLYSKTRSIITSGNHQHIACKPHK